MIHVVLIGTGNVANHIAQSFNLKSDIKLVQVFNHRSTKEAKSFAKQFNCNLVSDYKKIITTADVYIIAVKDEAIAEVVKQLVPIKLNGLVVHTSGSVEMNVLKNVSAAIGVYYPLQTFYKGAQIDWNNTPILIEGNTKKSEIKLKHLANLISKKVKIVTSINRLKMHLAAVFACNFTNAMFVAAYQIIESNLTKKDTDLLLPIIQHSVFKLQNFHPKKSQTGPAMRSDKLVIKKHLALIKDDVQLTKVYKTLTELIVTQQNLL